MAFPRANGSAARIRLPGSPRRAAAATGCGVVLSCVLALGACSAAPSATSDAAETGGTTAGTASPATSAPVRSDPGSSPATAGPGTSSPNPGVSSGIRTKRYCEVLLVTVVEGVATAEVNVSFGLNDCPAEHWERLDPAQIAADEGVTLAVLNGPRYWLMDSITKERPGPAPEARDFGGIGMYPQATVEIGSLAEASVPYAPREVERSTIFTFDAGQTVYELTAPDGATYVMQSWSQQRDPDLEEADLAGLGARLQLPAGWTYGSRVLDEDLEVVTTSTPATVLQDELANSYSKRTDR